MGWRFLVLVAAGVVAGTAAEVHGTEQAGVSAAVRGEVVVTRETEVGRQVESGEPIYLNDSIRSGAESGMQILLLDETVFTLGAHSEIVIDDFVYDPSSREGSLDAQIVKGAFRFVSGKVARSRPDAMRVRLPNGTIGIRGTIVAGRVDPVSGSEMVVLLGPGRNNNTADEPGRLAVRSAGVEVNLERPNFATEIAAAGQPPSTPFLITPGQLESLMGDLAAGAGRTQQARRSPGGDDGAGSEPAAPEADGDASDGSAGPAGEGEAQPSGEGTRHAEKDSPPPPPKSASDLSGQKTAMGLVIGDVIEGTVNESGAILDYGATAGQDQIANMGLRIATVAELLGVPGGSGDYDAIGVPLPGGGSYDMFIDADFNTHQVAVDVDNINAPQVGISSGMFLGSTAPFGAGAQGLAEYTWNGVPIGCGSCQIEVGVRLLNGPSVASDAEGMVRLNAGPTEVKGETGPIRGVFGP